MRKVCLLAAIAVIVALGAYRPAAAVQQFFDAFVKNYVAEHQDKKFVELVTKEAKCLVCHQGTKSKKNRNPFGKEVAKLLNKQKDAKDADKIAAELKKALALHTDPKDDKSPTFLDRVKAGKLPGGEFDDLKKEPAEEKK